MRRPSRKTSVYALAVKVNIKMSELAIKIFLNMTRLSLSSSDVLHSKGTRARKLILYFAILCVLATLRDAFGYSHAKSLSRKQNPQRNTKPTCSGSGQSPSCSCRALSPQHSVD